MLQIKETIQSGIPVIAAVALSFTAHFASEAQSRDSATLRAPSSSSTATAKLPAAKSSSAPLTQFRGAEFYKNFPAIASMSLPNGWYTAAPGRSKRGILQRIKPSENSKDAIDFFIEEIDDTVLPVSADEIRARQAVMKRPDHVVTSIEMNGMPELFYEYNKKSADPYRITRCRTLALKGKRTIVVEGDGDPNPISDGSKVIALMVDTSGTCKKMTVFSFSADTDPFKQNVKKVLDAIDTVKWK
jgi:hypothetical protein